MYCTHSHEWARCHDYAEKLWARGETDPAEIKQWHAMRDREQKAAGTIATRLRLTPQARYDQSKRIPAGDGGPKP